MRYKFIIVLLCIFIQFCDATYKPPKYAAITMLYILNTYLPEQRAKEQQQLQCSQPNAIQFGGGYKNIYCINNKVSNGLIFDANTMIEVQVDIISPGQSFLCQCGSNYYYNQWQRGVKVEDNPPSGTAISLILFNSPKSNIINTPLKYIINYTVPDNLYCITRCPTESDNYQYQFLKIR